MSPRFAFGKNWLSFLSIVSEQHITNAIQDLRMMLGDLSGQSFLDIGCGSGLHSLAAVRLGASRVHSFDYDPDSVACTAELKRRFASDANWSIERGSALEEPYLQQLGEFDVVYSWGVLHHTGQMWTAIDLCSHRSKDVFMLSIYNDQGLVSSAWRVLKRSYNGAWRPVRFTIECFALLCGWGPALLRELLLGRPLGVVRLWRDYHHNRGMSPWHDVRDWAGGYPFEVAKPEEVFEFLIARGFSLIKLKTSAGGVGPNVFVFRRTNESSIRRIAQP